MTPAVQFEQVTIRRGQQAALDAATFVLPTGSLTAVLGPNGAGKSTLLRAINGELRPAGGWVRVLGEDPATLDWRASVRLRRRTGVLARRSAAMIARGARCGWNASVCKRWRSGRSRPSPAASSAKRIWRASLPRSPNSFCSTSRPATWTCRRKMRSRDCKLASKPSAAPAERGR